MSGTAYNPTDYANAQEQAAIDDAIHTVAEAANKDPRVYLRLAVVARRVKNDGHR